MQVFFVLLYLIMHRINLNDQLSFTIEQGEKRLRLIVLNGDEELVCHKATQAELQQFIKADKSHLFKGRLQLDKTGAHIGISVKNKTAGAIHLKEFQNLIDSAIPINI